MNIIYFGIYRPTAPRDKNLLEGLRKSGINIQECVSSKSGIGKFLDLVVQYRKHARWHDVLLVGYLSALAVPLARLLTRKKIVFNAGYSTYEAYILDRELSPPGSLRARLIWFLDWISFRFSDLVLVESLSQKKYLEREFGVPASKMMVTFTAADTEIFFPDSTVEKSKTPLVVFRGFFVPATGVEYVLEVAKKLKEAGVAFRMIGRGPLESVVRSTIAREGLDNIELITCYLEPGELRRLMLEGWVLLGQFGDHPRMLHTIQHKTFEALALGMPYVTMDSVSNREILLDGDNARLVDPTKTEECVNAVLNLIGEKELRENLSFGAQKTYEETCTPEKIAKDVVEYLSLI
jgi:glycosyltransferase involved in cell wall biosynthesis